MAGQRDLHNELAVATSLAPAARSANTTVNGTGIDLAGFRAAAVVFVVGAITDGTHTPKIQESDDNATFTDVAAADQSGTLAVLAASTNQEVSYLGSKRYIRAVSTTAGATTGGVYAAVVVRGNPLVAPA
jgi:hypothetical protein